MKKTPKDKPAKKKPGRPKGSVRIVNTCPSWETLLPTILMLLSSGSAEGKATANAELRRMAKAADMYNESLEK